MSCKLEACEECTLMCHVMHRRNGDASSIATSFFKVMFGFNYNDFLLMPPTFARRIQHSNGQEVQLEDSSGEQWTVKVSEVEDSLAFVEGWNTFAKDHRLKVGEILVFHHINLSNPAHFFVQIYGTSGCPVFRFNDNGNSNKRSRTEGDFGDKAVPSCVNDKEVGSDGPAYVDSGSKRSRTEGDFGGNAGPSYVNDNGVGSDGPVDFDSGIKTLQDVPKTRQFEEPLFMIERDDGCIQEEDRSCLFDLSKYELPVGDKKSSHLRFLTNEDVVNNDLVNLSGNILKILIEKPEENFKKIVVRTEEEAVCQKAENASITLPIESERSSREDKRILKSPSEAQVFNNDSVKFLKMPKNAREQHTKEKSTAHAAPRLDELFPKRLDTIAVVEAVCSQPATKRKFVCPSLLSEGGCEFSEKVSSPPTQVEEEELKMSFGKLLSLARILGFDKCSIDKFGDCAPTVSQTSLGSLSNLIARFKKVKEEDIKPVIPKMEKEGMEPVIPKVETSKPMLSIDDRVAMKRRSVVDVDAPESAGVSLGKKIHRMQVEEVELWKLKAEDLEEKLLKVSKELSAKIKSKDNKIQKWVAKVDAKDAEIRGWVMRLAEANKVHREDRKALEERLTKEAGRMIFEARIQLMEERQAEKHVEWKLGEEYAALKGIQDEEAGEVSSKMRIAGAGEQVVDSEGGKKKNEDKKGDEAV